MSVSTERPWSSGSRPGAGLPSAWPVPGLRCTLPGTDDGQQAEYSVSSRAVPEGGAVVEVVIPNESGAGSDA